MNDLINPLKRNKRHPRKAAGCATILIPDYKFPSHAPCSMYVSGRSRILSAICILMPVCAYNKNLEAMFPVGLLACCRLEIGNESPARVTGEFMHTHTHAHTHTHIRTSLIHTHTHTHTHMHIITHTYTGFKVLS